MTIKPTASFICKALTAFGISLGIIPSVSFSAMPTMTFINKPALDHRLPWLEPPPPEALQYKVVERGQKVALNDSYIDSSLQGVAVNERTGTGADFVLAGRKKALVDNLEYNCVEANLSQQEMRARLISWSWREKIFYVNDTILSEFYDQSATLDFNVNTFVFGSNRFKNGGAWTLYKTSNGGGFIVTSDSIQRFAFLSDGTLSLAGRLFAPARASGNALSEPSVLVRPDPRQLAAIEFLSSDVWYRANDFVAQKSLQFQADGRVQATLADGRTVQKFWSFLPGDRAPSFHGYLASSEPAFARHKGARSDLFAVSKNLLALHGRTFIRGHNNLNQGIIVCSAGDLLVRATYARPVVDGRPLHFSVDVTNRGARCNLSSILIERTRLSYDDSSKKYRFVDKLVTSSYGHTFVSLTPSREHVFDLPVMINSRQPAIVKAIFTTEQNSSAGFSIFLPTAFQSPANH